MSHVGGGRLPQSRWQTVSNRAASMEILRADRLESSCRASLRILPELGIEPTSRRAREALDASVAARREEIGDGRP